MRILHLYNKYHLGDNIFNFILFNKIKKYIDEKYIIYYYCQPEYINQVSEFNNSKNIYIKNISEKPDNSVEIWINNKAIVYNHDIEVNKLRKRGIQRIAYNTFYVKFFNFVLYHLKIKLKIKNLYYTDTNLFDRYNEINIKYKNKYSNIDILFINSQPMSGQYNYDKIKWDNYIKNLNNSFKIITTTKVENINCTMDDNLTIKDIGSLSTKSKVIIAINSGVLPGCLNKYTLKNVKHVYIFDDRNCYDYPNFENKNNIEEITLCELTEFIHN
jgi:hypothetical protein